VESIEPDLEEEIRIVEEFENRCIYHYGRQSGEETEEETVNVPFMLTTCRFP
jgi:hypothetical protein